MEYIKDVLIYGGILYLALLGIIEVFEGELKIFKNFFKKVWNLKTKVVSLQRNKNKK